MAFEELDNTAVTKVDVPEMGVVVGTRAAGRAGKMTRYLAIKVGAKLAKELGFFQTEQKIRIRAGTGTDEGSLAIDVLAKGKFVAKKQTGGHYLITVNRNAIGGRFSLDFPAITIDKPRFVTAIQQNPPYVVFKLPLPGEQ